MASNVSTPRLRDGEAVPLDGTLIELRFTGEEPAEPV
jgi:hypothetical protein